jgi:uncharacterized MAPEG superfamily protein
MEQFAQYSHAIVSLAVFALIGLAINPIAAVMKPGQGVTAGAVPPPDYGNVVYRWSRAYLNAAEMAGFFVAVTAAAILAGADPSWVNWLASIFLVSRVLVLIVHVGGFGSENMGPRTIIFVVGWLCCIILALMAIVAAV